MPQLRPSPDQAPDLPTRPRKSPRGWAWRWWRAARPSAGAWAAWPEEGGSARRGVGAWFKRQIEREGAARSGFHMLPVSLMIGVLAVFVFDWRPNLTATSVATLLFALAAWRAAARPVLRLGLTALAGMLCGGLVSLAEIRATDTTIISGTATTRIAATVVERARDDRGRMRYVAEISGTTRPVLSRPPERAKIMVSARHDPIAPGEPYYGLVRLGPPSGPAAVDGYDFAFLPFFDGVGAQGFALGAPDAAPAEGLAPPPAATGLAAAAITLSRLRGAMTDRIVEAAGGGEAGAIAAALVTGERAGISDEAETWLRGVGLAHVLSISGLHLAIVAGSALILLRSLFALFPVLPLQYPVKKLAASAALLIAALYLFLSGANVATERAFVMLAVMLVAVMCDRPALTLRNVSIAAIVVILLSPHMVVTASFQMSFSATLALIAGYGAFMRWRGPKKIEERRSLATSLLRVGAATIIGIVASSLMAGAATAPFAAYHFHRVAPFGLVANVLTLPLFTLVIMPLGLIGSLLMPFGLDGWCFALMGFALDLVLAVSEWLYGVLPDRGTGPIDGLGVAWLSAALLAVAFFASQFRWIALPFAVVGLLTIRDTDPLPQLLIYEDGKMVAAFGKDGDIAYLRDRPKRFVADQWERSFLSGAKGEADEAHRDNRIAPPCKEDFCRFETRDGIRVAWTDDYRKTGQACDTGDVAIVARAIRLSECRSGAALVTLRTLRKSGSLEVSLDPVTRRPIVARAVPSDPPPWNLHRLAPWPEYWRKPKDATEP